MVTAHTRDEHRFGFKSCQILVFDGFGLNFIISA